MRAARIADITPEAVLVSIDVAEVLRTVSDAQLRTECERRRLEPATAEAVLTGPHVRGARGLLGWSLDRLARESGVSVSTIKRFEDGTEGLVRPGKVEGMRSALETAGVVFRAVEGVLCVGRAEAPLSASHP